MEENNDPKYIKVRGARVHKLKNIDVDVHLHQIAGNDESVTGRYIQSILYRYIVDF